MSFRSLVLSLVGLAVLLLVVWKSVDFLSDAVPEDGGLSASRNSSTANGEDAEVSQADPSQVVPERTSEPGITIDTIEQPVARPWALEVTLGDGQPAEAARVAVVRDQSVLSLGATDPSGRWETVRRSGPVDLLIEAREAPLFRTTLTMEGDRGLVELPVGSWLAGQVLIDGRVPEDPVALVLYPDQEGEPVHGLPEALWTIRFGRQPLRTQTDASGSFRFGGLDPTWSGRLQFPRELVLEEEAARSRRSSLEVAKVTTDLALRLKWRALLRGRVLDPAGEALADAMVGCRLWGLPNMSTGGKTAVDGTFAIPVRGEDVQKLDLDVRSPDRSQRLQRTLEGDFDDGADLGDLLLKAARTFLIRVQDESGAAVPGALVRSGRDFEVAAEATDAEGKCQIAVPADTSLLRVMAVGFETRDFELPASEDDPVVVTLQSATRVEIQVTGAGNVPVPGLLVIVKADQDLFRSPDDGLGAFHRSLPLEGWDGTEIHSGWSGDGGVSLKFVSDPEGHVIVYGIAPGVPFNIDVQGPTGRSWVNQRITLEEGERRMVPVELAAIGRMLKGHVMRTTGEPLTQAWVSIRDPAVEDARVLRGRRLPQGQFEVGPFFAPTVAVFVRCPGYAPQYLPSLFVPESGLTQVFRLEPGYDVRVVVLDEEGRRLPGVRILFDLVDWPGASPFVSGEEETDAAGQAVLTDLPAATLQLVAEVAGRSYEVTHNTTAEEVQVVVPVNGSLEVQWDFFLTMPMSHELRLTPRDDSGEAMLVDVDFSPYESHWIEQIPHVIPGAYDVQLEVMDEDMSGARHVLTVPQTVVVRAREVSGVVLPAR